MCELITGVGLGAFAAACIFCAAGAGIELVFIVIFAALACVLAAVICGASFTSRWADEESLESGADDRWDIWASVSEDWR